jgi:hypothetical protein
MIAQFNPLERLLCKDDLVAQIMAKTWTAVVPTTIKQEEWSGLSQDTTSFTSDKWHDHNNIIIINNY